MIGFVYGYRGLYHNNYVELTEESVEDIYKEGGTIMAKAVEFVNINKRFPGVHVLKDISFSVEEGEVHALLGENGAGKSTLLNILHGVYPEYEGEVRLHGEKVSFKDTNDAIVNGRISKVHQETLVVKDLTVGQKCNNGL